MRRLITGPASYLSDLARSTVEGWNAFFFRPSDPTPVALIRLSLGLLLLWNFAVLGLDLHAFLGAGGWADPEAVRFFWNQPGQPETNWSLWLLVPDALLVPAYAACLVVLLLFTVGLWSRVSAVLTWMIVISTANRAPVIVFGFDQIAGTLALYLAVTGSSGQAVSVDRWWSRWRSTRAELARRRRSGQPLTDAVKKGTPEPTIPANLCLRLIQLHLCLMYGLAGLAKLQHPIWWEGWAFGSLLGYAEFRPIDLTWLAQWPMLLMAFSHAALFLEIGYPALVWVRVLRPLIVCATIALHVGIMLMMGLYEFAFGMIIANLAFASGPWLRSLVVGRDPEPLRVVFDGACPRCRASVALAGAADPDHSIEWIDLTASNVREVHSSLTPEACMRSMHAVGPGDRVRSGFDAVLAVSRRVPLFWPLAVLGAMPGVTQLGRRLYNALAASRRRDGPCTDDVCGLPSASTADRAAVEARSRSQSPKARR